jgi:hypothetical protein
MFYVFFLGLFFYTQMKQKKSQYNSNVNIPKSTIENFPTHEQNNIH